MNSFKRRVVSIWLSLCMILSMISPQLALAVENTVSIAGTGKVIVDIEKFSLGQGYILEPVEVPYTEGMTVKDAIGLALTTTSAAISIDGLDSGYIKGVSDPDQTVQLPPLMREAFEEYEEEYGDYFAFTNARKGQKDYLKEQDYTCMSGWMYTLDSIAGDLIGTQKVEENQVIRLRYTISYGADLGNQYVDETMHMMPHLYTEADKLELIRLMAKVNANKELKEDSSISSLYHEARLVTSNLEATQNEIDELSTQLKTRINEKIVRQAQEIYNEQLNAAYRGTLAYIENQSDFTQPYKKGSQTDWRSFILGRAGKEVPTQYVSAIKEFVDQYNTEEALEEALGNTTTEFARMTIGLTAAGYDASSVLGHNLLAHIYNSKSIENQGINAYVYGLLALDTRPYEVPQDALYTREKLVQLILESQLDDGSFCYAPEWGSDIDLTAIAIQALAPYYTQENVKIAVDKATAWLSSIQLQNGGFESWGEESSESLAQVICAVTSLGRDPETDPEFTKPQGSLMAHLLTFYDEAENGFKHTTNGEVDFDYATPQAAYALVAASRYKSGKSALYDMSDLPALKVIKKDTQAEKELLNKKENVISYLEANTNFTTSYEKGSNRDWSVLALARMGQQIPSEYAEGIGAFIGSFKDETELLNTLSTPTEFARMTIGLTAAGYDASHVAQHDLVRNIYNNKGLEAQGINALIYGLIALDTKPYEVPQDALYTREKLVQLILKAQFSDGSFGYAPEWGSDIDLTAMAIQALAPYRNDAVVKEAIDKALSWLSQQQLSDGGFMSYGSESCESVAQVICALTSVGKNPATEAAFIKAGGSLLSNFLSFYDETTNGFKHSSNDSASLYTTQQASYALAAYIRAVNGEKPLYDMSDIGQYKKIALKVYTIDQNEAQTIKIEDNKADVLINQKEQNVTATLDVSNCKDALPQIQLKDGDDHYKIVIPKSTQITAGTTKLLLPTQVKDQGIVSQIQKITGSGQSVSKIIQHIELGSKKESIQFNNKIKVIFKNAAGNQVAYKDHLGKVYAIKKLQADADKSKYNEVCYDLGKDLVVETNHLTEYIVYGVKDNTPSGGVNNPGTVNISVERKTIGLSDLYNGTVNYESGDTVYSVLVKTGLSIEGSSNYVTGINGLKERDEKYGKGSGWMVTVNGSFINSAVGQYKVSPGDTIRWQYTCNYGKDLGSTVGTNDGNILGTGSAANALDAAKKLANTLSDKEDLSLWQILTLIQDKQKVAESYKKAIIEEVKNNQGHYRKVTDIEKTVLALTSLGVDCTDVEGYNLIEKIYNNEDLLKQGSNGLIFALIAVDSKDYKIPNDAKWTREKMKEKLISLQNKDGGFSLVEGETSDIDITAMALQALAPYKDEASSKKVIERAINYLSNIQKENGEFEAYGEENCESLAQVIIALTSLNIDPAKDARFIKNGRNLLDVLMDYQVDDSNFCHKKNGGNDKLATEQAFMALVSYKRYQEGKSGLYNLKDIKFTESAANNQENGTQENKKELGQFTDAAQVSTWAKEELQEAVNEGIISGYGDSLKPQKEVTRAEFTVMLMRVLAVDQNSPSSVSGNESSSENIFKDVNDSNWFAKEVTSAYQKGLVTGMGDKMFKPNNEITREQAAVMLAKLVTNAEEVQSVEFKDKNHIAEWAKPSVKIVYSSSILKGYADGSFKPKVAMSREAAAVTLLRLKKSLNQN